MQGAFILIATWTRPRTTPHVVQRGPGTPGFIVKRVLNVPVRRYGNARLPEQLGTRLGIREPEH